MDIYQLAVLLAFLFPLAYSPGPGFAAAPQTLPVIKVAGSLYVLWLAWKLWRAGTLDQQEAKPANLWDGVVLLVLNPKAYVIIALMFSQFLPETSSKGEVTAIAAVFTVNNLVAFTLWTTIGDGLANRFRAEKHERYMNATFGGILAIVGVWMLLS